MFTPTGDDSSRRVGASVAVRLPLSVRRGTRVHLEAWLARYGFKHHTSRSVQGVSRDAGSVTKPSRVIRKSPRAWAPAGTTQAHKAAPSSLAYLGNDALCDKRSVLLDHLILDRWRVAQPSSHPSAFHRLVDCEGRRSKGLSQFTQDAQRSSDPS
ncbi:hypothetical protein LIA77_00578 [Sarocladium implicatum]|nr:hypothetical protein LIA77_00578 [Sarocladium implicatum]